MTPETPKPARKRKRRAPLLPPREERPMSDEPITAFTEPTATRPTPDNFDDDAASAAQRNVERDPSADERTDEGAM